jgi:hypothetical protein
LAKGKGVFDLEEFRTRYQRFKKIDYGTYPFCFSEFWKWKLKTEGEIQHILGASHLERTYAKLGQTLKIWQWHRPSKFSDLAPRLRSALENIRGSYDQIRKSSMLEFDRIPDAPLELIWHELGSVKEHEKNPGAYYSAMATTKPLMFLWGQTLAFDSVVRGFMPKFGLPGLADSNWSYETWRKVMLGFQDMLEERPDIVECFKELSLNEYGTDSIVPYGQFIDLYYWVKTRD